MSGRVRVNARLISAGGNVLWSRTFDRVLGEALALEADVRARFADGVRATVTPEDVSAADAGSIDESRGGAGVLPGAVSAEPARNGQHGRARSRHSNAPSSSTPITRRPTRDWRGRTSRWVSCAPSRSRKRAHRPWRPRRGPSSSTPESSAAHEVLADLKFYYDWDWHGRRGVVSQGHRAEPQLGSRAHAVRAVSS